MRERGRKRERENQQNNRILHDIPIKKKADIYIYILMNALSITTSR